jgi:hypothetical protein
MFHPYTPYFDVTNCLLCFFTLPLPYVFAIHLLLFNSHVYSYYIIYILSFTCCIPSYNAHLHFSISKNPPPYPRSNIAHLPIWYFSLLYLYLFHMYWHFYFLTYVAKLYRCHLPVCQFVHLPSASHLIPLTNVSYHHVLFITEQFISLTFLMLHLLTAFLIAFLTAFLTAFNVTMYYHELYCYSIMSVMYCQNIKIKIKFEDCRIW